MNNWIKELEQLTDSLISRFDQISPEELADFVEKRQQILDHILDLARQHPLSYDQENKLHALIQHDAQIRERMEQFKQEASDWLRQREQAKLQRTAYDTPYSANSILMDRRK